MGCCVINIGMNIYIFDMVEIFAIGYFNANSIKKSFFYKIKRKKNMSNKDPKSTKFGELKKIMLANKIKTIAFFQGLLRSQTFINLFFLKISKLVFVYQ